MRSLASNYTSAALRASPPDGGVTGVLIAALGLWAAVVPLVGPYLGYDPTVAGPSSTSSVALWTMVMPGAALVMCGAILVATDRRVHGAAAAVVAVLAGAWLAVGPAVWSTVSSGSAAREGPATADQLGMSAGLGAAAVLLAGITLVRLRVRTTRAVDEGVGTQSPGSGDAVGGAPPPDPSTTGDPSGTTGKAVPAQRDRRVDARASHRRRS